MRAPEQAGLARRIPIYFLPVSVLAGAALIVAGFGTARFWLAGIGIGLIVLGTLAFVWARPQGTNWRQRSGRSFVGIGLVFLVAGLFGTGPDDGAFRILLGGTSSVLGVALLAVDARRRSKAGANPVDPGAA